MVTFTEEILNGKLHFLCSALSFSFRIGKATVSKIISETCDAIYTVLKDTYLFPPQSKEEWLEISSKFEELWDMPHVIGCPDGKHIRIECPNLSGTVYHNYKGSFSTALLAICDANYYFTLFDLGQFGSNNDSGVLSSSQMGEMFEDDLFYVPEDSKLNDSDNVKAYHIFCLGMKFSH